MELRFEFDASSPSFTASNLFLHSDGSSGVARIEGSSKGRCEIPPSNCREYIDYFINTQIHTHACISDTQHQQELQLYKWEEAVNYICNTEKSLWAKKKVHVKENIQKINYKLEIKIQQNLG